MFMSNVWTPRYLLRFFERLKGFLACFYLDLSVDEQERPSSDPDPDLVRILEAVAQVQAEADALAEELKAKAGALAMKLESLLGKYSSMLNIQ